MTDTYTWKASYDALGRRLQTKHTAKCSDRFGKDKVLATTSFYDPEQEFLEIGVNYDGKIFWKCYGSISCDALTDSFGNSLTLLHDVLGNLSAIVSAHETTSNQSYPSAYGPQELPSEEATLLAYAQSLTWQSHRLDPTGLIWLGARYYDPQGGRFLSPDPISHPICLDLYAYANGDPINNVDLDGRFASSMYDVIPSTTLGIQANTSALPKVVFNDNFESHNNRSRRYDLSDLGRQKLPDGMGIGFVNGMGNSFEDARKSALYISESGTRIHDHDFMSRSFLDRLDKQIFDYFETKGK